MSKGARTLIIVLALIVVLILLAIGLVAGKYNTMITKDETVKNAWAQVENQYKRRFDLIPNLVETVKGYAEHERETFTAVTEARAKVGQLNISPEIINNPQAFSQFQQAQDGLSGVLSRLMVVLERYPELKANQNFIRLQDELAGTENRIAVERKRFNDAVLAYNGYIRRFPTNIFASMFGFKLGAYFEAPEEAGEAPKVEF
ncbi:MAG: LemA family protein [Gemmatimonadota bacterium]|nr:MAG: LemA family protein [Gemmatimonadota bacterium]